MLVAHTGSTIEISVSGPQAREAMDALVSLVENRFGESV